MKTLNLTFSDSEFRQLKSKKKHAGDKSWERYVLRMTGVKYEESKA
tara:strand:+ start:365 stop:502 length:138 start_codon:yes stop_codon:yes gene_type:complete